MTLDGRQVALAICLAFAIVLGVNAVLLYGLLRGGYRQQIRMLRDAVIVARNPWKAEDEQLAELHSRVAELSEGEEGVEQSH